VLHTKHGFQIRDTHNAMKINILQIYFHKQLKLCQSFKLWQS